MRDENSDKLRPNFHYEDSDPGTVRIITEGTCKAVYGVEQVSFEALFLLIFSWRTLVLCVRPLLPLFWTSGDVCPGFQNQGGFLCMGASKRFLRFTSGGALADFLVASMPAKLFLITYLHTSIESSPVHDRTLHRLTARDKADALPLGG